ncbi:MAG: peptide-methionine (R)-S-oxide reductase MsrB [Janthinobacterium lividum]
MMSRRSFIRAGSAAVLAGVALQWRAVTAAAPAVAEKFTFMRTDEQWRKMLTPEQYNILRKAGTERPYSSPLNDEHRMGTFACAGCEQALFSSNTKFDSGTGWPSFWQPLPNAVVTSTDSTLGMVRSEVHCKNCGGHQGHVFDDGPKPTGLRYCMNGLSMKFNVAKT